jgi:hypothetical protein
MHRFSEAPNHALWPTAAPLLDLGVLLGKTVAGWLRQFVTCEGSLSFGFRSL